MTENHNYHTPAKGQQDWHIPLNDNFERLDIDVEIRDLGSNRDQYTAEAGSKYLATDTGAVYIGDGQSWNRIASSGSNPTLESVQTQNLNDIAYPEPANGGAGIMDALSNHDAVVLRAGTYETDVPIIPDRDKRIIGAGAPGSTVIKATSSMPAVFAGRNEKFDRHVISNIRFDANGQADHCLLMDDSNLNWNCQSLELHNSVKDGLRIRGGFNSVFTRVDTHNIGRHGVSITHGTGFRASSINFVKCHIDTYSDTGMLIGPSSAGSTQPNVVLQNCDISGGKVGLRVGRYGAKVSVFQSDFEFNNTGIQIGDTDMQSYVPNKITLVGGGGSGNDTFIDIRSGKNINIIGLADSDSATSLRIRSNAGNDIVEMNNSWYGDVIRDRETISLTGDQGTKSVMHRGELVEQDLTQVNSNGTNDYRHHDGSGGSPVGLYRGNGSGGWVRVEDNSIVI